MSESLPVVRIVDDDVSFLASLARLLKSSGYSVRTFTSAADLLANIGDDAGCVIVDLRMPEMGGLDVQRALLRGSNALPVVFLSGDGDIPATVKAMRAGAEDFLTKRAPKADIFAAVDRAIARDGLQRADADRLYELRVRTDTLTARELGVLSHVVQGRLNKQIAADLGITERTVKLHRTAITTKLKVRSVAGLTKLAQEARLFDQSDNTFPKGL
jgi:two-component system, LuxR family, response regulator FixJ